MERFIELLRKMMTDSGKYSEEDINDIEEKARKATQTIIDEQPPADKQTPALDSKFWENAISEVKRLISEYIKAKYSHDATGQWIFLILVALLILTVGFLSFFQKITPESTSTLIASIIGYSIGRLQQKINNKSSE